MGDSEIHSEMRNMDLRKAWESDEMWKLRKAFLERHWSDKTMTKNRLLCLSQIFINAEFLGTRYDESIMAKVAEMSEGLADERREQRRNMVQKIFVKGGEQDVTKPTAKKRKVAPDDDAPSVKKSVKNSDVSTVMVTTTHPVCAIKMKMLQALKAELMVMQQQRLPNDPLAILNQACGRAKCLWQLQFDDAKHSCYLQIDDVIVVQQVYWGAQARSRTEACRRTVDILQRPFFEVRQINEKAISPVSDLDLELYTRREARGEWESAAALRFDPLEQAFNNLRKRLLAIPQEARNSSSEKSLRDAAKLEDLPVDIKRQHLGGWKEEIIVTVGKVELCRHQGRIPPKGQEQESASECFTKATDALLKSTLSDGVCISEESGVLSISAKPKAIEKPAAAATVAVATNAPSLIRRPSRDQGNESERKELSLKSVRLHLNATSETMNPVQRIENSCSKAKVPYDVKIETSETGSTAIVRVDGVRIGSGTDAGKKAAKSKACVETIQKLLKTYIRIKSEDNELILEASDDPFAG